jgi:sugar lactone lactonase YvrE
MVVDGRAGLSTTFFDFGNPQAAPNPGMILLVTPDGGPLAKARVVADGLAFPNGMVITPDGRTLIVGESYVARLTAYDIESDGSLSHNRVWAQFEDRGAFSEGQITPDGISLDAEGAVWVASPNTKDVLRVREGAEITHRIPMEPFLLACMLAARNDAPCLSQPPRVWISTDSNTNGRIESIQVDVPGADCHRQMRRGM